ncbi:hypothetical protein [Emticicia sp. SJ17W-69]|uniref:hypothetical protein n=1 Tax=Emticicia sp. SJ17W-69 TaxID=3421657 RepID=UPI003EB96FB9
MQRRNGDEVLSGWFLYFDEVSNNVYKVELNDGLGRIAGCTDSDLEAAILKCIEFAKDIDLQLNRKN